MFGRVADQNDFGFVSRAAEVPHKRLYCRGAAAVTEERAKTDDEIRVPIPNSKVNVILLLRRTDNDDDDDEEDRGDRQH